MDTEKNVVNNQQPQQEEKKKKNKFVAWWLGLGKWAKVGICAGTAAVLATAITLPVVLSKKTNIVEIELVKSTEKDDYIASKKDYKKDVLYTFKGHVAKKSGYQMMGFSIYSDGEEASQAKLASAEFTANGENKDWSIQEEMYLSGTMIQLDKDYDVVFKIKLAENFSNGFATLGINQGR